MRTTRIGPNQALLQELFDYDAKKGWLVLKKPTKGWVLGKRSGGKAYRDSVRTTNYRTISVNGERYFEHRIVWAFHHGPPPVNMEIDHINHNGHDNRIENLRLATRGENVKYGRHKKGKSGYKNVIMTKDGRFRVVLGLGTYETAEEAAKVAYEANKKIYGNFVTLEMYGLKNKSTTNGTDHDPRAEQDQPENNSG
jgi:HNH endonuclease